MEENNDDDDYHDDDDDDDDDLRDVTMALTRKYDCDKSK